MVHPSRASSVAVEASSLSQAIKLFGREYLPTTYSGLEKQ